MSLLGSRSSSNILIRERVQTGEETSTTENQGTTQSRKQSIPISILYPDISTNQAHVLTHFTPVSQCPLSYGFLTFAGGIEM